MLCDSNGLVYAADPRDDRCAPFVERDDAAIASVSRIEVLGFPGFGNLSHAQQQRLLEMVASMSNCNWINRSSSAPSSCGSSGERLRPTP